MIAYIRWMIAMILVVPGICGAAESPYNLPEDNYIVDQIHQISHLTAADENRWKLLLLGSAQSAIASAAGAYASYQAGTYGYGAGSYVESALTSKPKNPGEIVKPEDFGLMQKYLSENLFNALTNKWLWALAGAVGVGIGAYKVINPRLERGMLAQVQTFVDMCKNFTVATKQLTYQNDWALLGTGQGESMWAQSSNIAREKGLADLKEQARVALRLLDQLEGSKTAARRVGELRDLVKRYQSNVIANYAAVAPFAQADFSVRVGSMNVHMQGAQQVAQRKLTEEQASALWYGKISLAFTAAGNFAKNTLKTLTYMYDNKEKIAGGLVAIYFLPTILKKVSEDFQKNISGKP